jgi:hypothetical protein
MKLTLKKQQQSVLGLSLGQGQLRAVLVSRSKGAAEVVKTASATLALDLLHPEAELIGREIKNHLDAAGIHERSCVIAVPANWVMSQHSRLPDLPPEDVDSYLQLEAEKGFPCDVSQLQIARSLQRSGGVTYVTQLAVRQEQLTQLASVARAAGLKPVSFSLGLAALPGVIAPAGEGRITVALEPQGAVLVASAGGGLAAFRTCEATIDSEAGEKVVNGSAVARELRITFEQVPAELRGSLRRLRLCGDEPLVRQLAERLGDWTREAGLALEAEGAQEEPLPALIARSVATQWLDPAGVRIEFLAPRPGRMALLVARYNAKRLGTTLAAVGAIVVVTLVVFLWQEIRLVSLRSDWAAMQRPVTALKAVEDRIRDNRSWYDRSLPDLRILAGVTRAFPENGSLTARTVTVQKAAVVTTVSVSGTARDDQALLRTQDSLRKLKEVQGLKVENISGKAPSKQFTLTFRWIGGGS